MEDTTPQRGAIHTYEGGTVFEPRLCDMAAAALHAHWPEEFTFDRAGVESKRELQRVTILNTHFRKIGRAELPMPKERLKVPIERANDLTEIQWDGKAITPEDPLREELSKWVGKPVTEEQLVSALLNHSRSPERRKGRLQFVMLRDGDQTGVYLRVRREASTCDGEGVSVGISMTLGGAMVLNSSGDATSAKNWEPFRRLSAEVLRSTPENSS